MYVAQRLSVRHSILSHTVCTVHAQFRAIKTSKICHCNHAYLNGLDHGQKAGANNRLAQINVM